MNKTNISWTDYSSNPIRARNTETDKVGWFCTKVSDGCTHCYSETLNVGRFGNGLAYTKPNESKVEFVLNEKEIESWRKHKTPSKIFVCDMTDLFHEMVSFEMILRVFYGMATADWHTFQVLTKRPERALEFFKWWKMNKGIPPYSGALPNVWFGVSVENKNALRRIDVLSKIDATVRFVSAEPLLEDITIPTDKVDWLICGAESGKDFRPMRRDWARSLRDQCVDAGVPFWFKQFSAPRPGSEPILDGVEWHQFPK